jgi:hypothetical protein
MGRSNTEHRLNTLSACVAAVVMAFCGSTALAAPGDSLFAAAPSIKPTPLRLRYELFTVGYSVFHYSRYWENENDYRVSWLSTQTISVQAEWNRLRVGAALSATPPGWDAASHLPITVGYVIWSRPTKAYWHFVNMVPEVDAEVTACWQNDQTGDWDLTPVRARADIVAGADLGGFGVSVAAGVLYIETLDGHHGVNDWRRFRGFAPSLEVRLRLCSVALDLSGL